MTNTCETCGNARPVSGPYEPESVVDLRECTTHGFRDDVGDTISTDVYPKTHSCVFWVADLNVTNITPVT